MNGERKSRLKRPRVNMPSFVRDALLEHAVMEVYRSRPPYPRNDYLGWITRSKLGQTRLRRLAQMIDKLARNNRYMNMMCRPKQLLKPRHTRQSS